VQSQIPKKSVKLKEERRRGIAMKHYSKDFKEEALKPSDEIGVKKAAQQLGIAYYTLADWRSIRRNAPPVEIPSAEEQAARIRELERENAELQKANEILKDAHGFSQKTAGSKSM
jgi:transposase